MANWPRFVLYGLKVTMSYIILAIIYSCIKGVFKGHKESFMAALMTATTVMKFTVGETLNRCTVNLVATILGASIGYGANELSHKFDSTEQTAFYAALTCIFGIFGGIRWYTKVLKGLTTTGSLVMAAGSAFLSTSSSYDLKYGVVGVAIGGGVCLAISMIYPVFARVDLHNHVVGNLEKFVTFYEELEEFFGENGGFESINKPLIKESHKTIINSKEEEDSLLKFVNWEPHRRQCWFPGDQYKKIVDLCQDLARNYCNPLCDHILDFSKDPTLISDWNRNTKVREECLEMSSKLAETLRALCLSMKTKTMPTPSIRENLLAALNFASEIQKGKKLPIEIWGIMSPIIRSFDIVDDLVVLIDELSCVAGYGRPVNADFFEEEEPPHIHIDMENSTYADRLKRWRESALVLNASRRFRYTVDLQKEEEKEALMRKMRSQSQVLRAAYMFKAAGE